MAKKTRLSKGTFKKCDMHVHSSSCYSRNYGRNPFFQQVLASDLDAIAVTDHNVVDTDMLDELQQQLAKKGKVLFAGVEVNVKLKDSTKETYGLTTGNGRKGEYFHAIIWCDMQHAQQLSSVVSSLFIPEILAQDSNKLTEDQLRSLACKEFSGKTRGLAIYLEDFQEKAAAIPHFFVPHENKDRSLSDYLPNGSRETPLYDNREFKDRLFYYSHAMAVEGGEKSRKHISEGLAEELNTTMAALFFSDAKKVSDIGSRFTWIDFDGDLDSLLLAISDPESRIKTSDVCPELPQTNTSSFLESVTFNTYVGGDSAQVHQQEIKFSPGFNGIVGSRGSGKTLLASVLANKDLDKYSDYIDRNSIKFKPYMGISSANRPECLYLGQGELEGIFNAGEYEQIPFLKERVEPLKAAAKTETRKALDQLEKVLKLEEELLVAFCSKYQNGFIKIDYLDVDVPSGITIDSPPTPSSDRQQLKNAAKKFASVEEALEDATSEMNDAHFKNAFPENSNLFEALETEAAAIRADVASLSNRVKQLATLIEEVDDTWFNQREELIRLFSETIASFNSESGSSTLNQYNGKEADSNAFFDDLLELRSSLAYLDSEASAAVDKMLAPIEPMQLTNSDDEIVISLCHEECVDYEQKCDGLLSQQQVIQAQPLVKAVLYQFDNQRMHKIFNGTRFKQVLHKGVTEHCAKFFELLRKSIREAGTLETKVKVGGVDLADMSPGMKAQALLKLFLNDSVSKGSWMYIVLDQPEDNLDVATIKNFLIDRIKTLKLDVQFFVVSHSAPVIVNGDARTVVVCTNDDSTIDYAYGAMNQHEIKQSIADVLDGGERYLKMRLNKYNFQIGDAR